MDSRIVPDERPLRPPEPRRRAGGGGWRWGLVALLLAVLALGAWRSYAWLTEDVARRRALATGQPLPQDAARPQARGVVQLHDDTAPPVRRQPAGHATAQLDDASDTGIAGVNKCVADGQVTYTNAPCPPPMPAPAEVATARAAHVTPATGPEALHAACGYLQAELLRLEHEFAQPLPPPVIDRIASRLHELRGQRERLRCAGGGAGASAHE